MTRTGVSSSSLPVRCSAICGPTIIPVIGCDCFLAFLPLIELLRQSNSARLGSVQLFSFATDTVPMDTIWVEIPEGLEGIVPEFLHQKKEGARELGALLGR